MNLLVTTASVKQSLLREKTSVIETSHTSDSSGGDSHTVGWGAGVELSWPALVKISSESRDKSGMKEKWPHCQSHATLGPRQQEGYCHFFCLPQENLRFICFDFLHWGAVGALGVHEHLSLHIQGNSGGQRQAVTTYSPQWGVPRDHGTWWFGISRVRMYLQPLYPTCSSWSRDDEWRPKWPAQNERAFWGLIMLPLEHLSHPS